MANQNPSGRAQWASSLGFILSAAGSAVGLGNIWKFPGKAYEGGGGAFLIIYLIIVGVIGGTVMLAEFTIGRHTQKDTIGAYKQIRPSWKGFGILGIITTMILLSYYFQVGGWVVYYIGSYIFKAGEVFAAPEPYFFNMLGLNAASGETFFPLMGAIICPLIFAALTIVIVLLGVEKGIEKFNKIGMPALFVILIALVIRSVTLPGAGEGLKYLLTPDFSKVTAETWIIALGQAFFSLSLGMSIMITYGSYLRKNDSLAKNTALICGMDTLVAFLAGFVIIPAVFATGGTPGQGGGFAFISLATVFQNIPGGAFFGMLFYLLLFFAAITSAMSLLEASVAAVSEQKKWNRKKTTLILSGIMFVAGIFYTISQASVPLKGIWFDFANGISFPGLGDFMEFLTDRLLIPINALASCLLLAWVWGTKNGVNEIRQDGKFPFRLAGVWSVLVKYIAPAAIIIIIVAGLIMGKTVS
jgi:NSS family neurotransmitter:Na+ symporter